MQSSRLIKKLNIAIVGAGTAGLMQAIALMRQFGENVKISLFEKHNASEWEQRGIELAVGPAFQIACRYLGMRIESFCEDHGAIYRYDPAFIDKNGNRIAELEMQMQGNHTSGVSLEKNKNNKPLYEMREFSVRRCDLMDFIVFEAKRICLEEKSEFSLNFGADITNVTVEKNGCVELRFADDKRPSQNGFDLLIGADGVHSKVRSLCFEKPAGDILPTYIGANILYGFIPERPEFYYADRFNISSGEDVETQELITVVMSGLKGNDNNSTDKSLWWAIIYRDQKEESDKKIAFWDKENSAIRIKQLAESFQRRCGHDLLQKLIEATPNDKFLYSGKFLERDYRDLKDSWGKDYFVLIGDAVHALMPWAGVGAGLASEDAIILAELLKEANILEDLSNKDLFFNKCNEVFSRLCEIRKTRIHYYTELTRAFVPDGILPLETNLEKSIENLNAEFGNQYNLNYSPFWDKLITTMLDENEKNRFFYINRENQLNFSIQGPNLWQVNFTRSKIVNDHNKNEDDSKNETEHSVYSVNKKL